MSKQEIKNEIQKVQLPKLTAKQTYFLKNRRITPRLLEALANGETTSYAGVAISSAGELAYLSGVSRKDLVALGERWGIRIGA